MTFTVRDFTPRCQYRAALCIADTEQYDTLRNHTKTTLYSAKRYLYKTQRDQHHAQRHSTCAQLRRTLPAPCSTLHYPTKTRLYSTKRYAASTQRDSTSPGRHPMLQNQDCIRPYSASTTVCRTTPHLTGTTPDHTVEYHTNTICYFAIT